jgi:hypothetical protein
LTLQLVYRETEVQADEEKQRVGEDRVTLLLYRPSSAVTHTQAARKEFDDLIAVGPGILPLVIEMLADPENFLALQLYDAIQPDDRLLVQLSTPYGRCSGLNHRQPLKDRHVAEPLVGANKMIDGA